MEVKVKYLKELMPPIKQSDKGDWIDLRSAADITLYKGEFKLIPLGISMKLPDGYEAILVPRSSLFKNHGLFQTNGIGIIDSTYCGDNDEWSLPVIATRETHIELFERIAQFRIQKKQAQLNFSSADSLGNEARGGFGSTGRF